jgi:uncharacterized membrane protein
MIEQYVFRFVAYVFFGLVMETIFSVIGIEITLGSPIKGRRLPRKHLEGFVSLYMIPLYGFGFFGIEWFLHSTSGVFVLWRYSIWCAVFTLGEVACGFVYDKILGFYPWDYYATSKYRMFDKGYTLWTLVPLWGLAGLVAEKYIGLIVHLSPYAVEFIKM